MIFLIPLIGIIPFLGLELFVGLIQAFIFSMLTLVFAGCRDSSAQRGPSLSHSPVSSGLLRRPVSPAS